MKKSSVIFLKIALVLIGLGALAFMLGEPQIEGRNIHSTLFEIYFKDLFLACAYIASIPFFVALYKAFKILGYAEENQLFSQPVLNALRTIKYCAVSLIGFLMVGEAYLFIVQRGKDDIAGGVAMGLLMIIASSAIAIAAAIFEKRLNGTLSLKP